MVRVFELTNNRVESSLRWSSLERGTPQVWFFSVPVSSPRGREFLWVGELSKVLGLGAWVHAWHWWRWPACKSSLRMFLTFIHDGNLNHNLGSQQRLHDLKITHWCRAILRLCKPLVCNLETGSQFPDSETAQHNIYIAQMHRLCRTYIQKLLKYFAKRSSEASFRSSGALLWMERWCSSRMVPQTHVTFKTVYHIWEWVSKFCIVRLLCELVSRQGAWTTRRWGSSDI